jgi:hypothetical protein
MPPHDASQSPGTAQTQLVWSSFGPEIAGRQTPPSPHDPPHAGYVPAQVSGAQV